MDRPYRHFTLKERRTLFRLLNCFGSHSPSLAALIARASETDVLLTIDGIGSPPQYPPLGAGFFIDPGQTSRCVFSTT